MVAKHNNNNLCNRVDEKNLDFAQLASKEPYVREQHVNKQHQLHSHKHELLEDLKVHNEAPQFSAHYPECSEYSLVSDFKNIEYAEENLGARNKSIIIPD